MSNWNCEYGPVIENVQIKKYAFYFKCQYKIKANIRCRQISHNTGKNQSQNNALPPISKT